MEQVPSSQVVDKKDRRLSLAYMVFIFSHLEQMTILMKGTELFVRSKPIAEPHEQKEDIDALQQLLGKQEMTDVGV